MKKFMPSMYQKDIFSINYGKLKKEGIKAILFDLDNTLSPAYEMMYCKKTKKLLDSLKKDFKIIIFSNNFEKRVKPLADFYGVDYACVSIKPLPFKYHVISKKYGLNKSQIAAVGDQLLTDILGGNSFGITTILIDPISDIDEKETWLNRNIEAYILKRFDAKNILKKGKYYE